MIRQAQRIAKLADILVANLDLHTGRYHNAQWYLGSRTSVLISDHPTENDALTALRVALRDFHERGTLPLRPWSVLAQVTVQSCRQ